MKKNRPNEQSNLLKPRQCREEAEKNQQRNENMSIKQETEKKTKK